MARQTVMDAAQINQHLANYAPRYTLAQLVEHSYKQQTLLVNDTFYHNETVTLRLLPRGPLIDNKVHRQVHNMRVLVGCAHVLCFKHAFLTPTHLGLVTEHASLGSLYSKVLYNKAPLPPAEARWYFQQLVVAVHFLHTHSIAARDIKLDTCMLVANPTRGRLPLLKLTDFQASKDVTADAAHTRLGTLEYLPPEVLVTGAPNSDPRRVAMDPCRADLYCMGVCLYTMLARQYPWVTREEQTKNPMALVPLMVSRMQRGALTRPPDVPDGCWALLQGLLQVDPARRFGIEDIRTNEWFRVRLPTRVDEILNPSSSALEEPLPSNMQSAAQLDELLARAQGGPEPEASWLAWREAQKGGGGGTAQQTVPLRDHLVAVKSSSSSEDEHNALPGAVEKLKISDAATKEAPDARVDQGKERQSPPKRAVVHKGVKGLVACCLALDHALQQVGEGDWEACAQEGLQDVQQKLLDVFELVHRH